MDVTSGNAPVAPARLDWTSAIGTFVVNFSTLDYVVTAFLKDKVSASEFSELKNQTFKKRLNRVISHFHDAGWPPEKMAEFQQLITRLETIRQLRNHIAHGYFLLRLNPESTAWEMFLSLPRNVDEEYSAETRVVTFIELRTSLSELTELIEAFKRLTGWETQLLQKDSRRAAGRD